MAYIHILIGLVLLVGAGDILVRGAVSMAQRMGISTLVIGLTVIALGTSAPELVVGINAALQGAPSLALGNVVGSNIANILLVIGVPALVFPILCGEEEIRHNYIILLAGTALFIAVCYMGTLNIGQGIFFATLLIAFMVYLVRRTRKRITYAKQALEDVEGVPSKPHSTPMALFLLVAGLAGVMYGADLLVDGSVVIARKYGVSEALIGLTIIAVGTSLPELITAVMAALHKHGDVAIGNVIGSNIFNMFGIMGATAITAPVPVGQSFLEMDLWIMASTTLILLPFAFLNITIGRMTGAAFTIGYLCYLGLLGHQAQLF